MELALDLLELVELHQELHQLGPGLAGLHPLEPDGTAGRADPLATELVGLEPPAFRSAVGAMHGHDGAPMPPCRHRAGEVISTPANAGPLGPTTALQPLSARSRSALRILE